MKTLDRKIEKIEKEKVNQLLFSKREVLEDAEMIKMRYYDLYRSQLLGNLSQGKVCLTFESSEGNLYQVTTTIWAVGPQFITLKGGVTIPVNAIWNVD